MQLNCNCAQLLDDMQNQPQVGFHSSCSLFMFSLILLSTLFLIGGERDEARGKYATRLEEVEDLLQELALL